MVHENKAGTACIYRDDVHQYFMIELRGMVDIQDYKDAFNLLLDMALETGYANAIYNLIGLSKSDPEARAWFIKKFIPHANKKIKGHRKSAIVSPASSFQQMALSFVVKGMKLMGMPVTIKYFDTQEEAIAWITT